MALQVKRAGAAEYGRWVKMLVCGEPGAGKTRTASCWPNPLFISVEGGMMSVSDRQTPYVEIESSAEVLEMKEKLDQLPAIREKVVGVPVDTVIIDTIDHLARLLTKERMTEQRKDVMAIQDWGWLGDQLRDIVRSFRNLDMNVIFNCHLKSTEDSETGRVFHKPGIQGSMGDEIAAYVDLAVLLSARPTTDIVDGKNVRKIVRVLQTFPDANHPWVKDRSGRLPLEFPINFEDDYKRMDELIYGTIPAVGAPVAAAQPVPPLTATPEAPAAPVPTEPPKPAEAQPVAEPEAKPEEPVADPTPAEPAPGPEAAPTPEESAPDPSAPAAPEPAAEPEPAVTPANEPEESVSPPETASAEPWATCQVCGGATESKDQADLSFIRFRKFMCRKCFADAKKK
jgi:hypothetical protein